ncbi:MAG TPA: spermidine/putrescine ABC transporter substrate-binding protein [Acidimicrobiia bacterium]|nr:spermidine/putrescine ABC transporter substrate-binding protein [Acidimicrobiia bacterium]
MRRLSRLIAPLMVLALFVAACGGDEGAEEPDGTSAEGGESPEGATGASCALDEVDGDLNLYNWSEYLDPELVTAFEEQYAVDVVEDFYESNEALLAQMQAGAVYDLIVPSDYMVGIMIQNGLLAPVNDEAVPNLSNLLARFTELPYDPGPEYSAAYQYGTTGLGVNVSVVGEDFPRSWALIFDPELTADFPGGVSVLNDPREAMGAALKYLGYSLNDTDLEHLQEATDTISGNIEHIATFDSDQYDEALVAGEVAVSHGYSGNMIIGIGEAENPDDYEYILPEEGATLWIDNMAVPANAEHPCTAFTFMNYILDAGNGATLTNWNYYGTPNEAAMEGVDQEVLDFYAPTFEAEGLEIIEDTGDYEINFTDYLAQAKG